jgi:UDP-N-acetyl-D-glucosamine dehydrogenase
VLAAAATKPFAYLPHRPGAGVGGHCIPVVPYYLAEAAREAGVDAELVAAAGRVNDGQPGWVVDKLGRLLAERGQVLDGARVLLLGMAYKPQVADLRESAAVAVLERLVSRGAELSYHDPLVPRLKAAGQELASVELDRLSRYTAAVVLTAHSGVDYARGPIPCRDRGQQAERARLRHCTSA